MASTSNNSTKKDSRKEDHDRERITSGSSTGSKASHIATQQKGYDADWYKSSKQSSSRPPPAATKKSGWADRTMRKDRTQDSPSLSSSEAPSVYEDDITTSMSARAKPDSIAGVPPADNSSNIYLTDAGVPIDKTRKTGKGKGSTRSGTASSRSFGPSSSKQPFWEWDESATHLINKQSPPTIRAEQVIKEVKQFRLIMAAAYYFENESDRAEKKARDPNNQHLNRLGHWLDFDIQREKVARRLKEVNARRDIQDYDSFAFDYNGPIKEGMQGAREGALMLQNLAKRDAELDYFPDGGYPTWALLEEYAKFQADKINREKYKEFRQLSDGFQEAWTKLIDFMEANGIARDKARELVPGKLTLEDEAPTR